MRPRSIAKARSRRTPTSPAMARSPTTRPTTSPRSTDDVDGATDIETDADVEGTAEVSASADDGQKFVVASIDGEAVSYLERAAFDDALADEAAEEAAWALSKGWRAYHRALYAILGADDVDDKRAAVVGETQAFVNWLVPRAIAIFESDDPDTVTAQLSAEIERDVADEVERAGRKMSAARLKKLESVVSALQSLLSELKSTKDDGGGDDGDEKRAAEVDELKRQADEAAENLAAGQAKLDETSEQLRAATDEVDDLKTKLAEAEAAVAKYRNAPAARQSVEPSPTEQDEPPKRLCDRETNEIARELGAALAPPSENPIVGDER